MALATLVKTLDLHVHPNERWAVLGPEAAAFSARLQLSDPLDVVRPGLDGLLLAGFLSASADPFGWLEQTADKFKAGSRWIIIDWQYEAPNNVGPELEQRVRGGKLSRWLRDEAAFSQIDRQSGHALYYVVKAVKGPVLPTSQAVKFVEVAKLDELPKNAMKPMQLFGRKIIVANTGREIVAFAQACPHAHFPLDKGILRGRNLVCRSHAYIWNVRSGEPVEPADEDTLPMYPVKVDQDRGVVLVALPDSSAG